MFPSSMKFVGHRPALFPLVVPCRALAFPLAHTSTVAVKTYTPLIVISISLFFLVVVFLAVKLVYMKHRRIGTIHAPPGTVRSVRNRTSSFGFRDKKGYRHRGLLVGCLGSPTWETNLTSKLDGATWRRERRRGYHLHTRSTTRSTHAASARLKCNNCSASSRLTKSTALTGWSSGAADQLVLPLSSGPSRIATGSSSTDFHVRYGDFGECHPGGGVPDVARRASASSIRLVDGPSHSNQVEYSFLSSLPPNAIVVSPLMGTRDSFQLCRSSLKCNRKPVPPMPPLPSFLPFYLPKSPDTVESQPLQAGGYLPLLRFSPLASVAKVFHSHQQVVEKKVPSSRVPDPNESKSDVYSRVPGSESAFLSKVQHTSDTGSLTSSSVVGETPMLHPTRKTNHKKSQSCKGLAIGGLSPRTTLVTDEAAAALPLEDERCSEIESIGVLRTPGSSRNGSVGSKKVLKSCLRQNSVVPTRLVCSPDFTLTPSMSESSTRTCLRSTGDSFWTPISDVDIGILGLDRYRWNDENKESKVRSCHTKKDSVALVPYCE